jgi:transketolase
MTIMERTGRIDVAHRIRKEPMLTDTTQVGIFADELLACADPHAPNFVVVSADSCSSLRLGGFRQRFPERVVEVGIAEGCALAVAFGLSRSGLKAFVVGYSNFLLMRGLEVIRSHIAYHRADVVILGGMTGLSASHDGYMHQAIEDVGFMRVVEGMQIIVPSDEATTRSAARACVHESGPRYVRLVRREVRLPAPVRANGPLSWRIERGTDVLLCAFGPLLVEAVNAAQELHARGVEASVLEVGRVAPAPRDELATALAPFRRVVVVEDHAASSGLAAVIAEALSRGPEIRSVALSSATLGSGEYDALLASAGLSARQIADACTRHTPPASNAPRPYDTR